MVTYFYSRDPSNLLLILPLKIVIIAAILLLQQ